MEQKCQSIKLLKLTCTRERERQKLNLVLIEFLNKVAKKSFISEKSLNCLKIEKVFVKNKSFSFALKDACFIYKANEEKGKTN